MKLQLIIAREIKNVAHQPLLPSLHPLYAYNDIEENNTVPYLLQSDYFAISHMF